MTVYKQLTFGSNLYHRITRMQYLSNPAALLYSNVVRSFCSCCCHASKTNGGWQQGLVNHRIRKAITRSKNISRQRPMVDSRWVYDCPQCEAPRDYVFIRLYVTKLCNLRRLRTTIFTLPESHYITDCWNRSYKMMCPRSGVSRWSRNLCWSRCALAYNISLYNSLYLCNVQTTLKWHWLPRTVAAALQTDGNTHTETNCSKLRTELQRWYFLHSLRLALFPTVCRLALARPVRNEIFCLRAHSLESCVVCSNVGGP